MRLEEALEIEKRGFEKRNKIRKSKAKDYATDDVLSNFKRVSQLIGILGVDASTPHGIAMVYALLKIDRLCNLVFRKVSKPENESLEDTINDLKNYIDLLHENLIEEGVLKHRGFEQNKIGRLPDKYWYEVNISCNNP